jgi:iron complex transport system substrate-binding protein
LIVASGPLSAPTQLTIPSQPQRIISLSPSATETLYAIGAVRQVAAVDNQSEYPANVPKTDLSGYTPNIEAILGYQPDLVVATDDNNHLVDNLKKAGVPTLLLPAPTSVDEAYSQFGRLGAASGHAEAAAALTAQITARMAAAVAEAGSTGKHLTYYQEVDATYYTVTSKTFAGQLYAQFGMSSIADAASGGAQDYPQLSAEYIISANPDLIVLADSGAGGGITAADVAKRAGWAGMSAVQNQHVITVDPDLASRWGPRMADFAELIGAQVATVTRS